MKTHLLTTLLTGLLALSTFALAAVPAVSAAPPYSVSVGYADDLRPSPFFPSPWCGSPGVALFAGSCSGIDSGAVMITNSGATPITIDDVSINLHPAIGSPTFDLWAAYLPFSLPAGQSAIFVQTAQYNLDSSDSPLPGIGPSATNNCSAGSESSLSVCTTNAPQVTVTVGGVPTAYNDNGHTLDTGGFDSINAVPCPNPSESAPNCNESLQWRDISLTCGLSCPGGSGVPEFNLPVVAVAAIGIVGLLVLRRRAQSRPHVLTVSGSSLARAELT